MSICAQIKALPLNAVMCCISKHRTQNDITICGPITANLSANISTTDADFIVKVIDVLPDGSQTQQLVRAEILRGKFRNSFENRKHLFQTKSPT